MGKTKRKKKKPVAATNASEDDVPRSFVVHHGQCGKSVLALEQDWRHIMSPYTASHLKIRKKNVVKDFTAVAGPLGVSHLIVLSKTELSTNMRFSRLPRGPTLTFSISEYSLMKDIAKIVRRPKTIGKQFKTPPLLVMNGFTNDTQPMKLMITMFQNMFPSINVQQVKLKNIKRCVLLSYDAASDTIDFRHFHIEAAPVGLSRGTKKLIRSRLPNLGSLSDISEYMDGGLYLSESEGEEPLDSQVVLPQRVSGQGNFKSSQSAIKLTELGPRMTMQLIKIEEGVGTGEVLYHRYVVKSAAEKEALRKKVASRRKLKEERKSEQELNIKRKAKQKEKHRLKSLAGMGRLQEQEGSDIDDSEYFRREVGEEPPEELRSSLSGPRKRQYNNRQEMQPQRTKTSSKNESRDTNQPKRAKVSSKNNSSEIKQGKRAKMSSKKKPRGSM